MEEQAVNQALGLAVSELATKLADEMTTKNLLAVQLTASQERVEKLEARVMELEALLEAETQPANREGE